MSVSQFPNATFSHYETLLDLLTQLVPNPDPATEKDIERIVSAYHCAAVEFLIKSSSITRQHALDPTLLQQIKDKLDECR